MPTYKNNDKNPRKIDLDIHIDQAAGCSSSQQQQQQQQQQQSIPGEGRFQQCEQQYQPKFDRKDIIVVDESQRELFRICNQEFYSDREDTLHIDDVISKVCRNYSDVETFFDKSKIFLLDHQNNNRIFLGTNPKQSQLNMNFQDFRKFPNLTIIAMFRPNESGGPQIMVPSPILSPSDMSQNIMKNLLRNSEDPSMRKRQIQPEDQRQILNTQKIKRDKERTIEFALQKVNEWRKIKEEGYVNQQGEIVTGLTQDMAAKAMGMSKKTLEDYSLQIRKALERGFSINDHLQNKMGTLRRFNKDFEELDSISSDGKSAKQTNYQQQTFQIQQQQQQQQQKQQNIQQIQECKKQEEEEDNDGDEEEEECKQESMPSENTHTSNNQFSLFQQQQQQQIFSMNQFNASSPLQLQNNSNNNIILNNNNSVPSSSSEMEIIEKKNNTKQQQQQQQYNSDEDDGQNFSFEAPNFNNNEDDLQNLSQKSLQQINDAEPQQIQQQQQFNNINNENYFSPLSSYNQFDYNQIQQQQQQTRHLQQESFINFENNQEQQQQFQNPNNGNNNVNNEQFQLFSNNNISMDSQVFNENNNNQQQYINNNSNNNNNVEQFDQQYDQQRYQYNNNNNNNTYIHNEDNLLVSNAQPQDFQFNQQQQQKQNYGYFCNSDDEI